MTAAIHSIPGAAMQYDVLLRSAGVLVAPSQFEAWFLSAAHSEADIDATLEAVS